MSSSDNQLKQMAALACLEIETDKLSSLENDISAIMALVSQLRDIDTTNVRPLLHPLDLYQRLRTDEAIVDNQVTALGHIAPSFADGLYKVPKVIEAGK